MNGTFSQGFPGDVLTWYQANVGSLIQPRSSFSQENIISQMARLNYGYDSRYLLTLTGRRDGYSGFGSERKYGVFPSVALGWNISNEKFMRNIRGVTELKLRASYGQNGNQAVGPFRTLSTLRTESFVNGSTSAPGYVTSRLGNPNLGWETTTSTNIGLDFGFIKDRIRGSIDVFNANTDKLLLNRSISTVHGISSITQNIGKTNNRGFELGVNTTNIQRGGLTWLTSANLSVIKNKIVDLYGTGKDDLNNKWFIGQPISVNYGYVFDGVWQTSDDYTHSPQPDAKPGYLKIKDVNKDNKITDADRQIQGQLDPKMIWGINNTVGYKGFSLYFLVQGMHGHERINSLLLDDVGDDITRNTLRMERWTPDNPTNKFFANDKRANSQLVGIIEPLDFVRLKDVSVSYDLSQAIIGRTGLKRMKLYVSGRNLATFTKWTGLDPELNDQLNVPLQREYVVGLNIAL
jgi:TonB-linked SusC/RagA family outer membrane protein